MLFDGVFESVKEIATFFSSLFVLLFSSAFSLATCLGDSFSGLYRVSCCYCVTYMLLFCCFDTESLSLFVISRGIFGTTKVFMLECSAIVCFFIDIK